MATLYHGSSEILKEIKECGIFGGIFASGVRMSALSHGDNLHEIEIDEKAILTNMTLQYEIEFDKVKNMLLDLSPNLTEENIDRACELILDDQQAEDEDASLLNCDDAGEAGWRAQYIKGQIAIKLGYKAVEMKDEHGISYLVLPGTKINHVSNKND